MSNSSSNHQANMQEGRESLSFLANIATGHYFNNVFPSNLTGQQQVMNQQPGSAAVAGTNAASATNAALSQYHMGSLQTTPSVPASNPSSATSSHFTNPALTTQNCSTNPGVAGQQYLATSMSSMALNFTQGMNAMHQNTAASLGSMSLPSVPGGNVCFQQNLSPHVTPFPLQVPSLQIPSPLRHPTLLQHQLLHQQQQQQQQAVTSQQSLMQSSLQQHNALQQQQTAFMHQSSLLPQSSQSPTQQQSGQVKQSSHISSAAQQASPVQQQSQSPAEQSSSSSHQQSLLQASKSGKMQPHLSASLSNCPPANKSSVPMESNLAVPGNSSLLNCNNRNPSSHVPGVATAGNNTNAAGRHPGNALSDANQCTEMFNTIREALSVADNNPEVSSAASIFSDEPTYLNPSNCSLSEAASNQLLAFNFLTTSAYQLMCRHCGFTTDFHMVFTRHMACHYDDKGYECPLCPAVCSSEDFLKRHVNEHLEGRMNATAKNLSGNISAENAGKKISQKNINNSPKNASVSPSKSMKRKKTINDLFGTKKSKPTKMFAGMGKKKTSQDLESDGDSSDENYTLSDGNSYSINKYHGPPLAHPNAPYNNKLQTNPKGNPSSNPGQENFDLYNPIDPIATTNRTLSYTDFYKKHSFMNVNSSMNSNGMHGGGSSSGGGSNTFNRAVSDTGNMSQMKDPCNNYTIEQLSGIPGASGFMGSHNNMNQAMYGNNTNSNSSSSSGGGGNNFQSEPLSLIVNNRTAGVGNEAPSPQAQVLPRRTITTCRVGCSHFGRTLPGEVGPATASANNNSNCAVSGSITNPVNSTNTNNTNGTSSSAYTVPNTNMASRPQAHNSRNSPNSERQEGSGSSSEHITVKIDPFDVAPSMGGGAARNHPGIKQRPVPSSYRGNKVTGVTRGPTLVNFDGSCFETIGDQNNGTFMTLTDANVLTLDDDDDDDDGDPKRGKRRSSEGGVVDNSVYVSKTHTSKYSVNYAISDKTRNLLGSSLGSWNASRNAASSRKNRKPRDYYNRGRGYYGGRNRRPSHGLGSKVAQAAVNLGDPCSVEDIIDYTVGAGLKMMVLQNMAANGTAGFDSSDASGQEKSSLATDTSGSATEGGVNEAQSINDDQGGLLTPLAAYDDVDNAANSVPLHFLHESSGAEMEPTAGTKGMSTDTSYPNSSHVDSETRRDVKLDAANNSTATPEVEDASKLLLAAVGLVASGSKEHGDETVPGQQQASNTRDSALPLENKTTGSLDVGVSENTKTKESGAGEETDGTTEDGGVGDEVGSTTLPNDGAMVPPGSDASKITAAGSSSAMGSSPDMFVCRICGFETHYHLVLARHAPSHHKRDGHII